MAENELQTEQIILEAARRVFQQSGIGGARMQEIADEAGINKASLHYYFRSKEKLFQTVFQEDLQRFLIPQFKILRDPSLTVEERIITFITSYTDTLIENLHLPLFILHEISRNPDQLMTLVKDNLAPQSAGNPLTQQSARNPESDPQIQTAFVKQIREGMAQGIYHEVDPDQYIISLIGMCVFPFAGRPMVKLLFQKNDSEYREFLLDRRYEIIDYAFRILKKEYQPYEWKKSNRAGSSA